MRFFLGGLNLEVTVVCRGLKQDFSFVPDHEHENQESQPLDHQSKWLEAEPWLLFSLKKKKKRIFQTDQGCETGTELTGSTVHVGEHAKEQFI